MRDRLLKLQKSLATAKANYLICIGFVNFSGDITVVKEMALTLSENVKALAESPSQPPILFIGGHYLHPKGGSLGGHTTTYDVILQENGKLSFLINNTMRKEKFHEIHENRIRQLVYTDLEPSDLDNAFWEKVIQTNFMNPDLGTGFMDAFYAYVDKKLLKSLNNKKMGRSFKLQDVGVCAWKSIAVWLHGKISPGDFPENRDPSQEVIYFRFKRFMFEKMLADFDPGDSLKATIKELPAEIFLKAELDRKIKLLDEKIKKNIRS